MAINGDRYCCHAWLVGMLKHCYPSHLVGEACNHPVYCWSTAGLLTALGEPSGVSMMLDKDWGQLASYGGQNSWPSRQLLCKRWWANSGNWQQWAIVG